MKVRDGLILRQVADATIATPAGKASLDLNVMVTLNETGAFLWRMLENDVSEQELVEALLKEYSVDENTARAGVSRFIAKLTDEGLIV